MYKSDYGYCIQIIQTETENKIYVTSFEESALICERQCNVPINWYI